MSFTKHGMHKTKLYEKWKSMKQRCTNEKHASYHTYGGRGIKVCDEWQEFLPFYEWAMSHGYEEGLSLDRIDNYGDYEPDNCRFVDRNIQAANRRARGKTEYLGVTLHTNKSCYSAYIRQNGKHIFWYHSRSKNECAVKRNEFIIKHGLDYPLNEIKDEYEDVRPHKNDHLYKAVSKNDDRIFYGKTHKEISELTGIPLLSIHDCYCGKRNSRKFSFEKVY